MAKRPERVAPPELFYSENEAKKYANSSRMINIQTKMSERAVELLNLPDEPCLLLDVGCGSGLSGEVLSEKGHHWVGVDISAAMLGVALEREVEGDLCYADMGQGMFFRNGVFDGCISISALQWLCNADKKSHDPKQRLERFFQSLYNCLVPGARAVFQLYPETPQSMELITKCAMKCGFTGGLVIDYPNSSKAKKLFLCLFAGPSYNLPQAKQNDLEDMHDIDEEDEEKTQISFSVGTSERHNYKRKRRSKKSIKDRDWVQKKKDKRRAQGKKVARDSKFTARKRKPHF